MRETVPLIDPATITRPKGRYTIEIFDADTGDLEDVRTVDNYISPVYEQHIAGLQYIPPWMRMGLPNNSAVLYSNVSQVSNINPFTAQGGARLWNPYAVPAVPFDSLIITDDPTAEDTDETWLCGRVVAWANRFKRTVPASGQEGLINESECALSNNGLTHKTVWDFTTQQGNGTFQTLGIGSVLSMSGNWNGRGEQAFWTAAGPRSILMGSRAPRWGSSAPYGINSNIWIEGTTAYWAGPDSDSASANVIIYSSPIADIMAAPAHATDPFTLDASGTPTTVCDSGLNFGNNSTSLPACNTSLATIALTRLGPTGDFVMAYQGGSGSSVTTTIRRFTAAGALVYSVAPLPSTTAPVRNPGLIYDGANLYFAGWAGEAVRRTNVYRLDPATGAVSATIPVPGGIEISSSTYGAGMAFDGTDLILSTDIGFVKMSTAGALVAPYCYGQPLSPASSGTAVTPWATGSSYWKSAGRQDTGVVTPVILLPENVSTGTLGANLNASGVLGEINNTARTGAAAGSLAMTSMLFYAGKLWIYCGLAVNSELDANGTGALIAVTGANMLSRAVLDSPVAKTTSQNMKITYELTWPGADLTDYPEHRDLL